MLKIEKQKLKFIIFDMLFSLCYLFVLYLFTFMMQGHSIVHNFKLLKAFIWTGKISYIIIPYLIILNEFIIIKSFIKDNFKTNVIVTIFTTIITIISFYKYKILELPFLPSDILLIGNVGEIASFGLTMPPISLITIPIILGIILGIYYVIRKPYYKKDKWKLKTEWYRIILLSIGIIAIYNMCISHNRFQKTNIHNELEQDYEWMGGNGVFFIHLGDLYTVKPKGYSEKVIEDIKNKKNEEKTENQEKANVIIIMNEAFSDPNKIQNVEYSVNPLEDIYNIAKSDKNCYIGNTATPVSGGGTSLPEFEVLTGLTSYYIEKQIFPYTSYIKGDMNSVVRAYKTSGYSTIGIHPYKKTFYNRYKVYEYLGFDKSVFEEDMENANRKGGYISDDEFANEIIKQFEENDGNKFIFGVTMQNHMPYENDRYDNYDIELTSEVYSKEGLEELQTYLQGVYDGNKMYNKLVQYLKSVDEKTILVMFGDHLPAFEKEDFFGKSNYTFLDMYTTPYIVWANYDLTKDSFLEYISPSNLALETAKGAGVNLPWYLKQFNKLYENYPAINNQCAINNKRQLLNLEYMEKDKLLENCEILQYDLLIKKKYIEIEG